MHKLDPSFSKTAKIPFPSPNFVLCLTALLCAPSGLLDGCMFVQTSLPCVSWCIEAKCNVLVSHTDAGLVAKSLLSQGQVEKPRFEEEVIYQDSLKIALNISFCLLMPQI
jgi:hypothetical protein